MNSSIYKFFNCQEINLKSVTGRDENEKDEAINEIMIEKAREIFKTMNSHAITTSTRALTKVRK